MAYVFLRFQFWRSLEKIVALKVDEPLEWDPFAHYTRLLASPPQLIPLLIRRGLFHIKVGTEVGG